MRHSLISVRTNAVGREARAMGAALFAARRAAEPEQEAWRSMENMPLVGRGPKRSASVLLDRSGRSKGEERRGDGTPCKSLAVGQPESSAPPPL